MEERARHEGQGLSGMQNPAHETGGQLDERALQAFFSDETELFRTPAEPEPGQPVVVCMRVEKGLDARICLQTSGAAAFVAMRKARTDDLFDWFEVEITCPDAPMAYRFLIDCQGSQIVYRRTGASFLHESAGLEIMGFSADDDYQRDFRILPGFHTPQWARGALQYQIFPDRFANGDSFNDVRDAEYAYDGCHVRKIADWDAFPEQDDYRHFYGGDLQGVLSKLDYLQSLGVEAIYFNPLFVSPSSHRYDVQDYDHIDPHLAIICNDVDQPLQDGDVDNAHAAQYVRRTTSPANLAASDAFFAGFCQEVHARGMRIILDGVFNHCGSFSPWMDREGIYLGSAGREPGAYQSPDSPYRQYFRFDDSLPHGYEGWWDFPTLPKLNYEESVELRDRIVGIARKWAQPPYSVDGWRLDVAADVGHSPAFNHAFWREFRVKLKEVNPDILLIAEHYGNPASWLQGDQWDTVMNYDAFMEPLTYFLTGMEKHSDHYRDDLYQNGEAFWHAMNGAMAQLGWPSLVCAMNELSNHDHSRFLTRTNGRAGRIGSAGSEAAGHGIDKRVMREAVVVQMTWPGAPTIYYADEAGQVGWTDPDSRRTYPWGNEDQGLIQLHRTLAELRQAHPSMRTGSFAPLGGGWGWIAFGRFLDDDRVAVVCNNADHEQTVAVRLRTLGVPDGAAVRACLRTTDDGFTVERAELGEVAAGKLVVNVPARTALILSAE